MWKTLKYNDTTYQQFEINEQGQIRNIQTNHIYKPVLHKNGYPVITLPLGKRSSVKSIRVHRAVAETFIPNPNHFKIVHHKDGNRMNFNADNLEWTSSKMNTHYSFLQHQNKYFNNRKLTQEDIITIKKQKPHKSYMELAREYNVSKTTIVHIIKHNYYSNGL